MGSGLGDIFTRKCPLPFQEQALAACGQGEAGIAQMCEGLIGWQVTGAEIIFPYHLSLLAETHGRRAQATEGLSVLTKARSLAERHEERWWEAELHRLREDLYLKHAVPDVSQAEGLFSAALPWRAGSRPSPSSCGWPSA